MSKKTDVKVGATLRLDGHDYKVTALNGNGIFDFARPDGVGKGQTTHLRGRGVTAELQDSGEGWLYLPNRVTPKAPMLVRNAVEGGQIGPEQEANVLTALRNHPKYFDRDDHAVRDINRMYGVKLWEV